MVRNTKRLRAILISFWVLILLQEPIEVERVFEDSPICVDVDSWGNFIQSVINVESNDNDSALCKKENAVGVLQIRPIMVREVNRQLRKSKIDLKYTKKDRWSRDKSIEMFELMAQSIECSDTLSFIEMCEITARKWNGGHRGDQKKATVGYWNKVKKELVKLGY